MALTLRPYQTEIKQLVYNDWAAGHRNVLMVLPTGGGKTVVLTSIIIDKTILPVIGSLPSAIMVHRKELVQQISLTLSEQGVQHNIIAPKGVIRGIIAAQRRVVGRQFYNHNATVSVISVDTLVSRKEHYAQWAKSIRLWITDEAAHVLKENKWGKAIACFTNAIGLGVTATPQRLDKRGLGRHADGVFDSMVKGPDSRWMIAQEFLSKYKIAIPDSDYRSFLKKASDGSDFSKKAMAEAAAQSKIVGDVVKNYQKFANGKQAILFASDIQTAMKMEKKFKAAGIKAKLLTGLSSDKERLDALIDYRNKKIQVLLNIDLFDEGLDVPGIECVIMARPTMSLGKFLQMIGRGLRPADGKEFMILIDHVGNVLNHGLPDNSRQWTLDRIVKRQDKTNLIRVCSNTMCNSPYDRALIECPWCNTEAIRGSGGGGGGKVGPEEVDGDLFLIDPETLRQMEQATVLEAPGDAGARVGRAAGAGAAARAVSNQQDRIHTQTLLGEAIAVWAGRQKRSGYSDRQINKLFYLYYGKTITFAMSEPRADMLVTMEKLR